MCRDIKTLFNFEPPATDAEIRASALPQNVADFLRFDFWAMHAAIVFGGAVALVAFWLVFGALLAPNGDAPAAVPAARPAAA